MTRAEELAAQIVCEGDRNTLEIQLSYARADAEALAEALYSIHGFQCGCEWPGDPKRCIALPSEDFAVLARYRGEKP